MPEIKLSLLEILEEINILEDTEDEDKQISMAIVTQAFREKEDA
jgi:hypothetical protein